MSNPPPLDPDFDRITLDSRELTDAQIVRARALCLKFGAVIAAELMSASGPAEMTDMLTKIVPHALGMAMRANNAGAVPAAAMAAEFKLSQAWPEPEQTAGGRDPRKPSP